MMIEDFLTAVLSVKGYQALAKSADRAPALWKIFVPRTVLGWLETGATVIDIPVVGGRLTKSSAGWSGTVGKNALKNASTTDCAAAITLSLGYDPVDLRIATTQLQRLGKHIDAMIGVTLRKGDTDLPGRTQVPTQQVGPQSAQAPIAKQPKMAKPKLPRKSVVKSIKVDVAKSETECPECGIVGFKDSKYVGCLCWRSLSKSVVTTAYGDGYVLDCGSMDDETFQAFFEDFHA